MGKTIVNAHSFKMDLSPFLSPLCGTETRFLLDSAFTGIYGNSVSLQRAHTHAHTPITCV